MTRPHRLQDCLSMVFVRSFSQTCRHTIQNQRSISPHLSPVKHFTGDIASLFDPTLIFSLHQFFYLQLGICLLTKTPALALALSSFFSKDGQSCSFRRTKAHNTSPPCYCSCTGLQNLKHVTKKKR